MQLRSNHSFVGSNLGLHSGCHGRRPCLPVFCMSHVLEGRQLVLWAFAALKKCAA